MLKFCSGDWGGR